MNFERSVGQLLDSDHNWDFDVAFGEAIGDLVVVAIAMFFAPLMVGTFMGAFDNGLGQVMKVRATGAAAHAAHLSA